MAGGFAFWRKAESPYWPARFSRRAGPDVAIPRLGYRLNALPSGTKFLAQRRSSRRTTAGARSISSPRTWGFQRRELDCASFHHDLAPIACELKAVAPVRKPECRRPRLRCTGETPSEPRCLPKGTCRPFSPRLSRSSASTAVTRERTFTNRKNVSGINAVASITSLISRCACHSSSGECATGSHVFTSWYARDRYSSLSIIVGAAIKPIARPISRKASRCEEERLRDRLARNARRLLSDASVSCPKSS